MPKGRLRLLLVIAAMAVCVATTRGAAIWHGLNLHTDEIVFHSTSSGVVNDHIYQPYKAYPEGAFLLQVPFQWLGKIASQYGVRGDYTARNWARLASIAYYMAGCVAGAVLVFRMSGRRVRAVCFYALAMAFSLLQIEMSRYGSGDPPSVMVLLLLLLCIDLYFEKDALGYLGLAFFLSGMLSAIKYPQIYFAILPIAALLMRFAQGGVSRWKAITVAVIATAAGFCLFSPALLTDPQFFREICDRELTAYLTGNNFGGYGTPLNNLASLMLYHLIYADVPLATPLVALGVYALCGRASGSQLPRERFFAFVLPAAAVLFAAYNVFMKAFFFRTLYPYFCICALYTAIGLDWLWQRKAFRAAVCVVCALTVARGSFLSYAMSRPMQGDRIGQIITASEGWPDYNRALVLGTDYLDCGVGYLGNDETLYYPCDLYETEPFPTLEEGDFAITSPYQFGFARRRLLGFPNLPTKTIVLGWEAFMRENGRYIIAKTYPDYYYYIFGYWMHGTTATFFEFPTNYVFYKPVGAG